jgi:hypothetical protein
MVAAMLVEIGCLIVQRKFDKGFES